MTYPEHPPIRPQTPSEPALPPVVPPPAVGPLPPPPYPVAGQFPPPHVPPWHGPQPRNGLGTAGMVLGIIGVVATLGSRGSDRSFPDTATLLGYFLVPVALGVLAVVFGATGRTRVRRGEATNSGRATAGLVLGIITLALTAVLLLTAVR